MRCQLLTILLGSALLVLLAPRSGAGPDAALLHLEIQARLEPATHALEANVIVSQGDGALALDADGALRFRLHGALAVRGLDEAWTLSAAESEPGNSASGEMDGGASTGIRLWTARPQKGASAPLRLEIRGKLHHPLVQEVEEYARSFARTAGTISDQGVMLSGSTWWLPSFGKRLFTFTLAVDLPQGWEAVSQGSRSAPETKEGRRHVTWTCAHPMEEVYLIANRFTVYEQGAGRVLAQAFLVRPDADLAGRYLEATEQYLDMYSRLIGPYPFEKFALVENFWETGYGMPSFTLLGPQVIRLPFILHSSYPHEILHNWWGNSVYVDFEQGNWCEGLTAYLADHLIREGQGRGEEYRLDTLKSYRNYVGEGKDFPLSDFRSRHSSATQAVGYGKALMLFHMLRIKLGEGVFTKGLQQVYRKLRYKHASFEDLAEVFGEVAGEDLKPFFAQWVRRTGAPALSVRVTTDTGSRLGLTLVQEQAEEPFLVSVPVAVTLEGKSECEMRTVTMTGASATVEWEFEAAVRRVDIDPQFDVFRRLHRAEIPATLSELFGAPAVTLIVPSSDATDALAWQAFAATWAKGSAGTIQVLPADRVSALPTDRSVWVLGSANPWRSAVLPGLIEQEVKVLEPNLIIGSSHFDCAGHSFAFALRHPADPERALGWVGGAVPAALPGLARKLPHYGKYSYLVFEGEEPTNVAKGRWEAQGSPLVAVPRDAIGSLPPRGALVAREPLARLAPLFDAERLLSHVRWLAADARQGRGAGSQGLEDSAQYIAAALKEAGLEPGGPDGSWFQPFELKEGPDGKPVALRNVVGILRGTQPNWATQSVVLGAHYDHLGLGWPDAHIDHKGEIHNGADDNASGIAVLIESARVLAQAGRPARTIVFVAFSGEEAGLKGSAHYVDAPSPWPAKEALAMINMDCVGRLAEGKLLLLGTSTAREWPHIAMGVSHVTGVEATSVANDPSGSDQASFHRCGVPAIQLFTGAHADYHRPSDDVEKIDAAGMVKVAVFVRECLGYLAGREQPLNSSLGGAAQPSPSPPAGSEGRRVSLGTVPAFDFAGPGVKVASVVPGSAAELAGVKAGDLLLTLDEFELKDLRAYQDALLARKPGDTVRLRVRRGEAVVELQATLVAR